MSTDPKKKVLFICKHNSARSQIAKGILGHLYKNKYTTYSAGTNPTYIHPRTIKVMGEIGIDIFKQRAKNVDIYKAKSFEDPSNDGDTYLNTLTKFKKVRNNIYQRIQDFFMEQ